MQIVSCINITLRCYTSTRSVQMLNERDAIKRESGILLASAMADEQLSKALLTVEELTMKLAQEQRDYEQQVNVI